MVDNWSTRVSGVWALADSLTDAEVLLAIDALVSEQPDDHAASIFEAASARDYVGQEAEAEPLYRRAIELGLDAATQPRAVIQLASTLRNLAEVATAPGVREERLDEGVALLDELLSQHPDDEWTAPGAAFLSLTLASRGQEREAASVALVALASLLPAYNSSVRDYALALTS
jgi:tetratricopeptide (TPR) repeat protein